MRLPSQLLLETDALGDVARVHHHAVDVVIMAKIGEVSLEIAPVAEGGEHAHHQLLRLAVERSCRHGVAVVLVHEAGKPGAEEVRLRAAEHRDHGLADVAATSRPEDEHEIGRRRDETAEMGRLPAGRRHERPSEKQREEQSADA